MIEIHVFQDLPFVINSKLIIINIMYTKEKNIWKPFCTWLGSHIVNVTLEHFEIRVEAEVLGLGRILLAARIDILNIFFIMNKKLFYFFSFQPPVPMVFVRRPCVDVVTTGLPTFKFPSTDCVYPRSVSKL